MTIYTGDAGNNTLTGSSGDDFIDGREGNDTLDGGAGNDILVGGPGADILTGGTGADTFRGTAADMNGDHITDFLIGDRIQFLDLTLADAQNLRTEGNTLYYTGGSLQIDNLGPGRFVVREISGGGLEIRLQEASHNDFNGDGHSDILLRDSAGRITNWLSDENGAFHQNSANIFANVPTDWKVVGTGDFNGDGILDILWRHDGGVLTDWLGTDTGGFTANSNNLFASVPTDWKVVGVGDFNGDGKSDIVWRNESGALTNWLATTNGAFMANDANVLASVPVDWKIAGTGDFNGDGLTDILWRNDSGAVTNWLATATGGYTANDSNVLASVPNDWKIVGTGDFNGDAIDDILWRHDGGVVTTWLGTSTGGYVANEAAGASVAVPLDWTVASIGDFNGDAIDDVLWRNNNNGTITDWLGTTQGTFTDNSAAAWTTAADNSWHVQDPFF